MEQLIEEGEKVRLQGEKIMHKSKFGMKEIKKNFDLYADRFHRVWAFEKRKKVVK